MVKKFCHWRPREVMIVFQKKGKKTFFGFWHEGEEEECLDKVGVGSGR